MNGKNYSCNNTGKRRKSDFYETPYILTKKLLSVEYFDKQKTILEPVCGKGAIIKVLNNLGYKHVGYDIIHYKNYFDFFEETKQYEYIITNPPFSRAYEFIFKCKKIAKTKFALLLPLSYLHGKKRFDNIFSDVDNFPLHKVWVFTRYPLLGETLRKDDKINTGMMVYAWFIWKKKKKSNPEIGWLDINNHILRKRDKL